MRHPLALATTLALLGCSPGSIVGNTGPNGSGKDGGNPSGNDLGSNPSNGSDGGGGMMPGNDGGPSGGNKLFVGYYQSWSDTWQSTGAQTVLAKLPPYVNVVNLSFMQPDTTYAAGSLSLNGTFLSFPYDGPTLKDAIAALHASHPSTKVMVSVGGATLYNWGAFNPQGVASFVSDFGLDGVDLDYEPATPNCSNASGTVVCPSDAEFVRVVTAMRAALPRPKWLSIAAWSVGAYGEGAWAGATPTGSAYTGIALAVLKDAQASAALDLVNVMSYDAGPTYSPETALAAYQHYFKGAISMGVEVPPEAWGGHEYTIAEIDALADAVNQNGGAGLMLWSIQKQGTTQSFATEMCTKLALASCASPML
jgi:chitinase